MFLGKEKESETSRGLYPRGDIWVGALTQACELLVLQGSGCKKHAEIAEIWWPERICGSSLRVGLEEIVALSHFVC